MMWFTHILREGGRIYRLSRGRRYRMAVLSGSIARVRSRRGRVSGVCRVGRRRRQGLSDRVGGGGDVDSERVWMMGWTTRTGVSGLATMLCGCRGRMSGSR